VDRANGEVARYVSCDWKRSCCCAARTSPSMSKDCRRNRWSCGKCDYSRSSRPGQCAFLNGNGILKPLMPNTFAIDPYSLPGPYGKAAHDDDYRNRSCTLVAISVPIICDISLNLCGVFRSSLYRLLNRSAYQARSNWSRRDASNAPDLMQTRKLSCKTRVVAPIPCEEGRSKCYAVLIKSRQNSVMVWT